MSTLDKLRALHQEVCGAWRRQSEPAISEGEAEVLNLGFILLEATIEETADDEIPQTPDPDIIQRLVIRYIDRVNSQFDSDADIKITEVPHNE